VSASLTVVVATIPADPPFDRIRFGWALEDAGWIATMSTGVTFSTAAFQVLMRHCRNGTFASYQFRPKAGGGRLVRIALGPEPMSAHFIPQFEEAGWKVQSGPMNDGLMLVVGFLGASRAGDPVTGQLILTAFPDTPFVDATVRFVRHKPVRGRQSEYRCARLAAEQHAARFLP
jgi:hypothetical protein